MASFEPHKGWLGSESSSSSCQTLAIKYIISCSTAFLPDDLCIPLVEVHLDRERLDSSRTGDVHACEGVQHVTETVVALMWFAEKAVSWWSRVMHIMAMGSSAVSSVGGSQ